MSSSFVVVIAHGSYHTSSPYQPFLDALKDKGIEGYCPQLPSSDLAQMDVGDVSKPDYDRNPPASGYPQPADDVKVLHALLKKLIDEDGKKVVLVGHSSGGFTATAAAAPEFQAKNRKTGGIVGIFYICGFLIPIGESVNSFFQPKDGSPPVIPPYCKFHVSPSWVIGLQFIKHSLICIYPETRLSRARLHKRGCKVLLQRFGRIQSQVLRVHIDCITSIHNGFGKRCIHCFAR